MTLTTIQRLRHHTLACVVILLATPAPGDAQTTGTVRGLVADRNGRPLAGARVTLVALGSTEARHDTRSDDAGQFEQTGLAPGQYSVSADTDNLGSQIFRVLVHPAGSVEVRFVLEAGRTAAPWLRGLQDAQAAEIAFAAGVRASRAGDFERAIEEYEAALRLTPTCVDCYFNIGVANSRLGRFEAAEIAYREALQIRSDYAAAYYGLAEVFTRQGRTEEAAAARGEANRIAISSLAAGRARARDTLRRGIEFWNSGNEADALRQFREALEADTTLFEAHYWLGLAYTASGDTEEALRSLNRYLGSTTDGEYDEDARQRLDDLER